VLEEEAEMRRKLQKIEEHNFRINAEIKKKQTKIQRLWDTLNILENMKLPVQLKIRKGTNIYLDSRAFYSLWSEKMPVFLLREKI